MNPSDEEDPPVVRGDLHNLYAHILEDSDPWMQDATACTHCMSCSFNICSRCSSSSLFQLLLLVDSVPFEKSHAKTRRSMKIMKFYIRSIPPKKGLEIYEIEMFEEIYVDPSPILTVDLGKTEDKRLTFERFVQWQRLALIHSSLSPESLKRRATRESKQNRKDMKEFNVICTDVELSYVRNIN